MSKIFIPRQIRFMGHTYKVRFEAEKTLAAGDWAQLDHVVHELRIYKDMHDDHQGESLFHELIHIVCDKFAIDIDEDKIIQLALGLYALMKDNKIVRTEDDIEHRKEIAKKKKKNMGFKK